MDRQQVFGYNQDYELCYRGNGGGFGIVGGEFYKHAGIQDGKEIRAD